LRFLEFCVASLREDTSPGAALADGVNPPAQPC